MIILPFTHHPKPTLTPAYAGVLNVDWLAFSVKLLETPKERDEHKFSFSTPIGMKLFELSGTNIYSRRLILFNERGQKILTLLCQPFSRVINYLSALVEVANEWLYRGFHWIFDLLNLIHPCLFLCLSRVDLCCDFQMQDHQRQLIQQLATNQAYVQGKRDGSAFFSYTAETTGIERIPRCLSWGSKTSNIKWKVYNKSAEIFTPNKYGGLDCSKPYIVDCWQAAGFDIREVWRCEVSISPMHKFQFHGHRVTLNNIIQGFYPEDLFISLYMTRFVIRLNQHHRDRSNDQRKHLLFDWGQTDRLRQYIALDPQKFEIIEYAAALNAAMAQLARPEVQSNKAMFDLWASTAEKTITQANLQGYFQKAYGYDYKNIRTNITQNKNENI